METEMETEIETRQIDRRDREIDSDRDKKQTKEQRDPAKKKLGGIFFFGENLTDSMMEPNRMV